MRKPAPINIPWFLALALVVGFALAVGPWDAAAQKRHSVALIQVNANHAGTDVSFYEKDFFKELHGFENLRLVEGAKAGELLGAEGPARLDLYWYNRASSGEARAFQGLREKGLDYVVIYATTVQDKSMNIEVYVVDLKKLTIAHFRDVAYITPGDVRSLSGFHDAYLNVKKRFYDYASREFS